jgi:cytochrome c oxidase subunit IV
MSSSKAQAHQEPNYMAVFWSLLVLTLLEVGIFYLHLGRVYLVIALVIMALAKAFLVAWYFMHLRFERWTLMIIAVIPLALAVDLYLGLMPDVGHLPF